MRKDDGTQIFYKDWSSGRPVVFSHGWPLSADAWDNQMMFLGERGYRVIAHDRRGHGRSDQTWHGNDMDTYADDLAELIETLDLHDAVLVGHSTGGGEVARYIGRHGRVAKSVLLGAVPPLMLRTERQAVTDIRSLRRCRPNRARARMAAQGLVPADRHLVGTYAPITLGPSASRRRKAMKVGLIGLGHMGAGMAASLLKAGHQVTVYNRTPAKVEPLVAQGAKAAAGVADACRGDAVITMLAATYGRNSKPNSSGGPAALAEFVNARALPTTST